MEKNNKSKQPNNNKKDELETLVKKCIENDKTTTLFKHPAIMSVILSLLFTMGWNIYSFRSENAYKVKFNKDKRTQDKKLYNYKTNLDKKLYDYKMIQDKKLYDYKSVQDKKLYDYKKDQDKKQDAYTNKTECRKLLGELINLTLKVKKAENLDKDFIEQEIKFKTERVLKLGELIEKTEYDLSAPECSTFAFLLLQQPNQSYKNIFYFIKAGLNKKPTFEMEEELSSYKKQYFCEVTNSYKDKNEKELKKILNILDKAIGEDSRYIDAYSFTGKIRYKLKRYKEAIDDFNKFIGKYSNNTEAYFYRGKSKFYLEKYKEAIKDFTKVIKADSDNYMAYQLRAYCWKNIGKSNKSMNDAWRAVWVSLKTDLFYFPTKDEWNLLFSF